MLLLELLSRLQNSNTSLLSWNLFTGLKFLNELNVKSSLSLTIILNTTQPSYLYDLVSIRSPHGHNTRSTPYVTLIKPSSSLKVLIDPFDMLHLIFGTSFLRHSKFFHPNYSSPSQRPSFEHAGLTYTAITFHHFFTVSLWAQTLHFQKILSPTLVCFCLSDWSHGSRPFTGLICSSVLCFSSILVISTCGRLSWPARWSTFRCTIK